MPYLSLDAQEVPKTTAKLSVVDPNSLPLPTVNQIRSTTNAHDNNNKSAPEMLDTYPLIPISSAADYPPTQHNTQTLDQAPQPKQVSQLTPEAIQHTHNLDNGNISTTPEHTENVSEAMQIAYDSIQAAESRRRSNDQPGSPKQQRAKTKPRRLPLRSIHLQKHKKTKMQKTRLTKDILASLSFTDSLFTFKKLFRAQHTTSTAIANPYPSSSTDNLAFISMEDEANYSQQTPTEPDSPQSLSRTLPINLFDL
jgi:hypothetical protein